MGSSLPHRVNEGRGGGGGGGLSANPRSAASWLLIGCGELHEYRDGSSGDSCVNLCSCVDAFAL